MQPQPFVPAPPGVNELEQPRPTGVLLLRIMSGLHLFMSIAGIALGIFALAVPSMDGSMSSGEEFEMLFYGVLLVVFCIVYAVLNGIGVWCPRRQWMYGLGIALAVLPLTCGGCWPLAIPVLIYWFKPEMKGYFEGQHARGDGLASTFR